MKTLLSSFVFCSLLFSSKAQQYSTAIGFKGSVSNLDVAGADFSMKHFFNSPNALEVNLGFSRNYVWLQGLYAYNIEMRRGVEWYYAFGGDFGYWNRNYAHYNNRKEYEGFWLGADANMGLEYTFDSFPINVSVDIGPTLRVIPYLKLGVMSGFAVRFALK